MMQDWFAYFDVVGFRPNAFVRRTVRDFVRKRRVALDIGSGNFRDSMWLKHEAGFSRVVAIDPCVGVSGFSHDGVEFHRRRAQTYSIERNAFDLVISCNTFFYLRNKEIEELIPRVMQGLSEDGVFSFNLLGKRDDWALKGHRVSSFSTDVVTKIVSPYQVVSLTEIEFTVTKNWHVFSCSLMRN